MHWGEASVGTRMHRAYMPCMQQLGEALLSEHAQDVRVSWLGEALPRGAPRRGPVCGA